MRSLLIKELPLYYALQFAIAKHAGQKRGKLPYVTHCIDVAAQLWELGVRDISVIAAALLHDVVEDTGTPLSEINDLFGERVTQLVEWLTLPEEAQNDRERKITLGPQDFKKIPLNNPYVVSRGGTLNPQFGSVKALHWNTYETSPRGLVSYTLAVGTVVVATEDFDPDGADVRKDEKGFVLLEALNGLGPLVRWFGGGRCNVYPTMCKAVWWDDTTQKIREGIT